MSELKGLIQRLQDLYDELGRAAILDAIDELRAVLEPPAAPEERGRFEEWARYSGMNIERNSIGTYYDNLTHWAWQAWHRRASQPPPVDDAVAALKEANELCRSSFQVCKRIVEQHGAVESGVNFAALKDSLERSLIMQHAVLMKCGAYSTATKEGQ